MKKLLLVAVLLCNANTWCAEKSDKSLIGELDLLQLAFNKSFGDSENAHKLLGEPPRDNVSVTSDRLMLGVTETDSDITYTCLSSKGVHQLTYEIEGAEEMCNAIRSFQSQVKVKPMEGLNGWPMRLFGLMMFRVVKIGEVCLYPKE